MPPNIEEFRVLHCTRRYIAATDFNLVRLALSRLENPLRLDLGRHMRFLEVILCDEYWACFDNCRNLQPVLAWTAFECAARGGLHEPVGCELNFYHDHAGLVTGDILQSICSELEKGLGGPRD